ncbi:MAG TPA: patatin-like phospholipase family protein [Candidatus Thermoplasmatota archaeon]|nr:patatin-like phospholipase family protein [Candidatus Thermoplasmatota archaeon]
MADPMRALVLSGGGGRGAYELGVFKAFMERGRRFDLISGTSVGAITGAAIASGLTMPELEAMWGRMHQFKVMQPRGDVWMLAKWTHLMYTKPLLAFIEREIDFSAIQRSPTELRISAVDVGTGDIRVFTNMEITPKRLLASASIPLLFPMVEDEGRHYWDGGTVVNTPLQPAIEAGANDITCVLLSPVGARELPPPANLWEALSRFTDLRMMGNLKEDLRHAEFINGLVASGTADPTWHHIDFHVVSPPQTLGLTTILNFDARLASRLIASGHRDGLAFLDSAMQDHRIEVRVRQEIHEAEKREEEAAPRFWGEIAGTDF